jgi:hypothetical protein
MRIRSLALALAVTFALTTAAEAKKRPVYNSKAQHARKANVQKYKATKRKVSKLQAKHLKRKA